MTLDEYHALKINDWIDRDFGQSKVLKKWRSKGKIYTWSAKRFGLDWIDYDHKSILNKTMNHPSIMNGRHLTDKELNEAIKSPVQRSGRITEGDFTWYVTNQHWKFMEPARMKTILEKIMTQSWMNDERRLAVEAVMAELKQSRAKFR